MSQTIDLPGDTPNTDLPNGGFDTGSSKNRINSLFEDKRKTKQKHNTTI
jgi:hypothetical protein